MMNEWMNEFIIMNIINNIYMNMNKKIWIKHIMNKKIFDFI